MRWWVWVLIIVGSTGVGIVGGIALAVWGFYSWLKSIGKS